MYITSSFATSPLVHNAFSLHDVTAVAVVILQSVDGASVTTQRHSSTGLNSAPTQVTTTASRTTEHQLQRVSATRRPRNRSNRFFILYYSEERTSL